MALRLPSATVQRLRRSQATYLDIGTEQDREYIELLVNLMTMHSYFIAPVRLLIIAAGKIYFWTKFFLGFRLSFTTFLKVLKFF